MLAGTVLGFATAGTLLLITGDVPEDLPALTPVSSGTVVVAMAAPSPDPGTAGGPETYGLPAPCGKPLPDNVTIDRIVVAKDARILTLFVKEKPLKSYRIALGFSPEGHKRQEGDGKTPEGIYSISGRNPKSAYHLSLRVSYPSETDRNDARGRGVSPGSDIMIHGLPNNVPGFSAIHENQDWTAGCIALTDEGIEELWRSVPNGTAIDIKP